MRRIICIVVALICFVGFGCIDCYAADKNWMVRIFEKQLENMKKEIKIEQRIERIQNKKNGNKKLYDTIPDLFKEEFIKDYLKKHPDKQNNNEITVDDDFLKEIEITWKYDNEKIMNRVKKRVKKQIRNEYPLRKRIGAWLWGDWYLYMSDEEVDEKLKTYAEGYIEQGKIENQPGYIVYPTFEQFFETVIQEWEYAVQEFEERNKIQQDLFMLPPLLPLPLGF